MSDLKVDGITAATANTDLTLRGAGTGTVDLPTAYTVNGAYPAVFVPNLIINGGFQVNQRTYVSTTATADGTYMHDRWRSGSTDSSYTFSVASPCSPQVITIAANDSIEQVIEGVMVLEAGTHTIAWTGTATARAVVNTQTMSGNFAVSPITVTAVVNQVITVQFTGANAAGGSTEATNTGTLSAVMCVLGSSAPSTFIAAGGGSYTNELIQCQRYYTVFGSGVHQEGFCSGYNASASSAFYTIGYPTKMRVAATMTLSAVGDMQMLHGAGSGPVATGFGTVVPGNNSAWFNLTNGGGMSANGGNTLRANGTTAQLRFDAEL